MIERDDDERWTPQEVVDAGGPELAMRCYLEQSDLRRILSLVLGGRAIGAACDIGTGYGRLLPVLAEFAPEVTGFEREPSLVATARALVPAAHVVQIERLSELPVAGASFDIALSFTVLQHHSDADAGAVLEEMRRVIRPDGAIVVCEDTDPAFSAGDPERSGLCTIGRPVSFYQEHLAPMRLVTTLPRRIEPTYPRPDTGTYMAFAGTGSV